MESPWKTVHVCQSTFLQSRLAKCFSIFRFVLTGLNDCAPVKKPYLQTLDCRTRKKHFWQPKRRWGVQSWRACKTEIRQRFHFCAQIECDSQTFFEPCYGGGTRFGFLKFEPQMRGLKGFFEDIRPFFNFQTSPIGSKTKISQRIHLWCRLRLKMTTECASPDLGTLTNDTQVHRHKYKTYFMIDPCHRYSSEMKMSKVLVSTIVFGKSIK